MKPLLVNLGEGSFFALVAGVTSMLGISAIGIIRWKGMTWRLWGEQKPSRGRDKG